MGVLQRIPLYGRTIANLKPVQITNRFTRALRSKVPHGECPPINSFPSAQLGLLKRAHAVGDGKFSFLNAIHPIPDTAPWDSPDLSRLWIYNLHYFDDLASNPGNVDVPAMQVLIARWVRENPPAKGPGWEPYPLSLRIVNWIKWHLTRAPLSQEARESLALQVRSLIPQLEFHLLGNHLLANAKALIYAGLFFRGAEAETWLKRGLSIWQREVRAQVLPDGGHGELSPMYHAIVLEDVLDLLWFATLSRRGDLPVSEWSTIAAKMLRWLQIMTHPDGEIAFFNDAALGIAPTLDELRRYAERLGVALPPALVDGTYHLPDSGYVRLQRGDAVVIFDAARPALPHLMGHAHADTLSFEFSLAGKRVVVNSGTSQYAGGPQRQKERATPSHSTVTVEGRDSSEAWSEFRMGTYAHVRDVEVSDGDILRASASHDGYARQFSGPLHHRTIALSANRLEINDVLRGGAWQASASRLVLAPGFRIAGTPANGEITSVDMALKWRAIGGTAGSRPAEFHREFGLAAPVESLCMDATKPEFSLALEW